MTQDQHRRLESALAAAKAVHFDHSVPDQERQDALEAAQAIERLLSHGSDDRS